jgi:hypothetical protein
MAAIPIDEYRSVPERLVEVSRGGQPQLREVLLVETLRDYRALDPLAVGDQTSEDFAEIGGVEQLETVDQRGVSKRVEVVVVVLHLRCSGIVSLTIDST